MNKADKKARIIETFYDACSESKRTGIDNRQLQFQLTTKYFALGGTREEMRAEFREYMIKKLGES